ncbi:general secretion pathway protein GspB [Vibrio breoganii]
MSQVLKALEQSQKQFEQTSTLTSMSNVTQRTQAGLGKARLVVAIVAGLGLGVTGHAMLADSSLTQGLAESLTPSLSRFIGDDRSLDSEITRVIEPNLDVTFLPATAPIALMPLPRVEPQTQLVASSSRPAPQPVMTVDNTPLPEPVRTEGEWSLPELDLSGLSPELASSVASVLDNPSNYQVDEINEDELSNVQVTELDKDSERFRGRLPALNLQTHMYASNPKHRWVKVNGSEVQEGDSIDGGIKIVEIAPRYIVVEFSGEKIEIPALYDWQG